MLNILDEPLVENAGPEGKRRRMSLPQTCEALMRGEVRTFPHLRPHQQHAWHSFLTQLAVLAVRGDGAEETPDGAEEWRRMILNLTGGKMEPWELLVEDWTRPAFMQPPARTPAGNSRKPGLTQRTPDNAD